MNVTQKAYNFVSLVSTTYQKMHCIWITTMYSFKFVRSIEDVSDKYR